MLRLPFDKKNEKAEQNKLEIRIYETTCSSLRVLDFINERRCKQENNNSPLIISLRVIMRWRVYIFNR